MNYYDRSLDALMHAYGRYNVTFDHGDGIHLYDVNQKEYIEDYIHSKPEIEIVDFYIDDGYSGVNFDRPDFQRMLQDIKNKKIDCVIVKDLSRLGRNYIEVGKYIERLFPLLGVRFIAINDNFDSADDTAVSNNIIIPFKNLINDAYCRDISIKIRSNLEIKRNFVNGWHIQPMITDLTRK